MLHLVQQGLKPSRSPGPEPVSSPELLSKEATHKGRKRGDGLGVFGFVGDDDGGGHTPKRVFISVYVLMSSSFCLSYSFCHFLTLPIWSCTLSTFSLIALNVFFINSLPGDAKICVISESGSDVLWLFRLFFLAFHHSCNFLPKARRMHLVTGAQVAWPLVWGFLSVWPGARLHSELSASCGVLTVICFPPLLSLAFPRDSPLNRVCVVAPLGV